MGEDVAVDSYTRYRLEDRKLKPCARDWLVANYGAFKAHKSAGSRAFLAVIWAAEEGMTLDEIFRLGDSYFVCIPNFAHKSLKVLRMFIPRPESDIPETTAAREAREYIDAWNSLRS